MDVFDIEKDFDIFANNYRNYDLINISRYLYRPLFDIIADQLNEGGFILIHQFMEGSFRPRKERFLLKDKELYNTFTDKGFKVIEDKIHYLNDGRPTSWFLARKQWKKKLINHTVSYCKPLYFPLLLHYSIGFYLNCVIIKMIKNLLD